MSVQIANLSLFFTELYEHVRALSEQDSLFQHDCSQAAHDFEVEVNDLQSALDVAHKAQRLIRIFHAGLQSNEVFHAKLKELELPSWEGFEGIDVATEMQINLADRLYKVQNPSEDIFCFEAGDKSKLIAELLLTKAIADDVFFTFTIRDNDFTHLLLNHCDEAGAQRLANYQMGIAFDATHRAVAYPQMSEQILVEKDDNKKDVHALYAAGILPIKQKSGRGEALATLTLLPTRAEAKIDRMEYPDYARLFFEMCDQPWQRISDAQKHLIEQFNQASRARFTNDWGTDISMDLVDHDGTSFTFCNSLIDKNIPGSEIFSAPRRDSVEGRIVSYGLFHNDDAKMVENLRLHFKNGCLQTWGAESGIENFNKFIENDPGNRYVGELGIGTNPHLKQHVCNGLLVEKIGGSFHLALGSAYTMKDYLGEPVHVDNGNRSKDHWDITTMLYGAGGRIYLDGRMIMDNGFFLDRRLDVLNRGWQAVPLEQRPQYWRDHPTPFKPV